MDEAAPHPPSEAPPAPEQRSSRIAVLDPLRGIAALAVMWFHFTNGGQLFDNRGTASQWIKASGHFGWAGVEFFFVISGFVLPYALQRGGYRLRDYGKFLCKRLIRLEPPYLASLVLVLGLWFGASLFPAFQGEKFIIEWPRLLLHLGYLNQHFGYESYNPVYWTLGIELQFYLCLALIYPIVVHRRPRSRVILLLFLLAGSLIPGGKYLICSYLPLFVLGMVTFQYFSGLVPMASWILIMAIAAAFSYRSLQAVPTLAGLLSALAIGASKRFHHPPQHRGKWLWRGLAWAGTVSYSIYLLHTVIGGRIINLGTRLQSGLGGRIMILVAATAGSLFAAWALHRFVEWPAQRWSAAIKFRPAKP